MGASTLITDYLGQGTHASRPATPPLPSGGTAIYAETDTGNTFAFISGSWVQINGSGGGGGGGPTLLGFYDTNGYGGVGSGNYLLARVYATSSFTLSKINFLCNSASPSSVVSPCVYATSGPSGYTASGSLLKAGASVIGVAAGINSLPLTSSLSVSANTYVHIGILLTGTGFSIGQTSIGNASFTGTSDTTPGPTGPGTGVGNPYQFWGS